jgi:integrase
MPDGRLSTLKIKALTRKGLYGDGNGLYLQIGATGGKAWIFRFTRQGRARAMGLGAVAVIPLAQARVMAQDCRRLLAAGTDPMEQRQAERRKQAATEQVTGRTFMLVASLYLDAHRAGWGNAKHAAQWQATLATYVMPILGDMPVDQITTGDVLSVLTPIWQDKTETASRVRGRIEAILSYAKALGWRVGENPAVWKDNLAPLLPAKGRIAAPEHHAALPSQEMPTFMVELCQRDGMAAQALQFLILTATRTGEVLGATWGEINLDPAWAGAATWTIPAHRMKGGREHRVPLSAPAQAILRHLRPAAPGANAIIFPGANGKPLSDMALTMTLRRMKRDNITVHGFRSTFRDWTAEATDHAEQVAEMALAHAVGDQVEAAYRRGDLFTKRIALMTDWAQFIAGDTGADDVASDGKVIRFRPTAA